MQADRLQAGGIPLALVLVLALTGCAGTVRAPAQPPPSLAEAPPPAPMPPPPAEAVVTGSAPATAAPMAHPADAVLAYADRVRGLPAPELAQEVQRLGETAYAPVRALQLAVALAQTRNAANVTRAQALLQRVQQDPEAQPLHTLARLLAAQLADQRRLEEQAERQAQLARDQQRRIEQLNERLEAVRAIERSLPTRPRREAPAASPPSSTPSSGARSASPRGGTP